MTKIFQFESSYEFADNFQKFTINQNQIMAIEFPYPQDELKENTRIAAGLLGLSVCISIILFEQTIAHPTNIIIARKQPKLRAKDISIAKTNEAHDQGLPSGFSKISDEDKIKLAISSPSKFIDLYGGLPLFRNDLKVGAIGVSGGTKMEDLAICFYSLKNSDFEAQNEWFEMFESLTENEKDELQIYFDELGIIKNIL